MTRFPHGVASGEVSAHEIVLWARVRPDDPAASVALGWRLEAADGDEIRTGTVTARPEDEHSVHVAVGDLPAGTAWRYRFTAGDEGSPEGRFRTLPEHPDRLRFAVVACAKYNAGWFTTYRAIAQREDLDFVLHLGDYIYEAANTPPASQTPGAGLGRDFDPLNECRTCADYRRRYAQYRLDPDVRALHAALPVIATLDDHELADNAWRGGAQEHDEARDGPWADRVAGALRAWREWTATRIRPADGDPIWRTFAFGDLARIAVLETRLARQPAGTGAPVTMLGAAQRDWLEREVAGGGPVAWTVLGAPSMISPIWSERLDADASFALRKLKLVEPETGLPFHDLWDAYGAERDWLLATLARAPGERVVLAGDVHVAVESELRGEEGRVAAEWVTTSLTSQNLDDKMGWAPRTRSLHHEERFRAATPHVAWCDFDSHGWLEVTIERERASCEWWAVSTVRAPEASTEVVRRASVPAGGAA